MTGETGTHVLLSLVTLKDEFHVGKLISGSKLCIYYDIGIMWNKL